RCHGTPGPGVTAGVEPQLVLQEDPGVAPVCGRIGKVPPQRLELLVAVRAGLEVSGDHAGSGFLPRVEKGDQQALLAAELAVEGARRSVGSLGHGVDGGASDAPSRDDVARRLEELLAGLGPALLLR